MESGKVKFYSTQKGFGFITPDRGGKDIFVHATALERAGMKGLAEGQWVEFDTTQDPRAGKIIAKNVMPVHEDRKTAADLNAATLDILASEASKDVRDAAAKTNRPLPVWDGTAVVYVDPRSGMILSRSNSSVDLAEFFEAQDETLRAKNG